MKKYSHVETENFLHEARKRFLKNSEEQSLREALDAIEKRNEANVSRRNKVIFNKNDKRILESSFGIHQVSKINKEAVRLNIFTEAICRYIMPALLIDESYKKSLEPVIFETTKAFLQEQVDADNLFLNKLSDKTDLLESIVDKVDTVTNRLIKRFSMYSRLTESEKKNAEEMSYDSMQDNPISLLNDEENDILNPNNSEDDIVHASEINEIIVNKVVSVMEDEKARTEENDLIIQDIKDTIAQNSGELPEGTEMPSDEEIAEAVLSIKGQTLFQKLLQEAHYKKMEDSENINEGLAEDSAEKSFIESVIRYTIAETLYTLKVYEPKLKTQY